MLNTLKYYVGDAYDSSTEKIIGIMIIASNKEEAQQRYKECIERYLELIAIDPPGIAECINSEDLVDMIFCKKNLIELNDYHSAPV